MRRVNDSSQTVIHSHILRISKSQSYNWGKLSMESRLICEIIEHHFLAADPQYRPYLSFSNCSSIGYSAPVNKNSL